MQAVQVCSGVPELPVFAEQEKQKECFEHEKGMMKNMKRIAKFYKVREQQQAVQDMISLHLQNLF